LITRVVADDALALSVDALLDEFRGSSPVALRLGRRALRDHRPDDFEQQLAAVERLYLEELMSTEDAREGIRAFLERRAPVWSGR
jgi:enoyl-CoA hydratase/carnithine racemase